MKSVFNKIEKEKSKEIVFPILAEALVQDEAFIVLFLSENKGIVVKGNHYNLVGMFSNDFIPVDNSLHWRILSPEESIVLSND